MWVIEYLCDSLETDVICMFFIYFFDMNKSYKALKCAPSEGLPCLLKSFLENPLQDDDIRLSVEKNKKYVIARYRYL